MRCIASEISGSEGKQKHAPTLVDGGSYLLCCIEVMDLFDDSSMTGGSLCRRILPSFMREVSSSLTQAYSGGKTYRKHCPNSSITYLHPYQGSEPRYAMCAKVAERSSLTCPE